MTDPNRVKIGDEYFAPEWFDFDRSQKMAEKPTWEWDRDPDLEDNDDPGQCLCPNCNYLCDPDDGSISEFLSGDNWYDCDNCGLTFRLRDAREDDR